MPAIIRCEARKKTNGLRLSKIIDLALPGGTKKISPIEQRPLNTLVPVLHCIGFSQLSSHHLPALALFVL